MNKIIIIGLIYFYSLNCFAQNQLISGRVFIQDELPLFGALICQANGSQCSYSDFNGAFHIILDDEKEKSILISFLGYCPLIIENLDTNKSPLKIYMDADIDFVLDSIDIDAIYLQQEKIKLGFNLMFQLNFMINDFNDFEGVLGKYNTDLMTYSIFTYNWEFGWMLKRHYGSLSFGMVNKFDNQDSLYLNFNTTQYGLSYGYNIFDSKRFNITPKASVKWIRYRLLNRSNENNYPIEQYLLRRDLDLRFNQIVGIAGLGFSYKMYKQNIINTDYWTIGIYAGYIFKLNNQPWIYSRGNRLKSDNNTKLENYYFGFNISFNVDGTYRERNMER